MIAQKLAAEGCNVAINYVLNAERAEATASSIERNHCVKTFLVRGVCDLHNGTANVTK